MPSEPGTPGAEIVRRPAPVEGQVVDHRLALSPDAPPLRDLPQPQDVARFSGVTRACPACGQELFDQARACWKCGQQFESPRSASVGAWALVAVALLVAAIVAAMML